MLIFHPCQFNFDTQSIDIDGQGTSGGTSVSGITDYNQADGGGFWRATFDGGDFGGVSSEDRAETLAWRAIRSAVKSGARPIDVSFCDQWHQPVIGSTLVPHSDDASFSDEALYETGDAEGVVLAVVNGQAGGLRATILDMEVATARELIGGERFTLVHPTWGPRAYQILSIDPSHDGVRVSFIPPVRGGVAVGDRVDFSNIRCRMQHVSSTDSLSIGLYTSASISFAEYMRSPDE